VAAASLLGLNKQTAPQALTILEKAREAARSDAEKINIAMALLAGYDILDQYDKALTIGLDLAKQYPESEVAYMITSFNLRALERFDEAERFAEERLQRMPGDVVAMRLKISNATVRKDYVKAHALYQSLAEEGKAEPQDLNDIAWLSLFTGKVEASDLEDALKASQLSNNSPNILHTLGCVYAEVGKTKEAREVLIQAMDKLNLDEPDDNYWFAFGRIAEQYGERDTALANYARVSKPKRAIEIPGSSYYLAQVRLQVLRSEPTTLNKH
jgi:tetratricopeptide (TPR) repeat protein